MKGFARAFTLTFLLAVLALVSPGLGQAANCGADVEKARAEWEAIKKKADSGEIEMGKGKIERSLDEVLRKADEASKAGKNRRCEKLLQRLRGRWKEKGWQ